MWNWKKADEIRISLSYEDFRALVNGEIVSKPEGVTLALQDIGFKLMLDLISEAIVKAKKDN